MESPLIKSSAPAPRRVVFILRRLMDLRNVSIPDNGSGSHVRKHGAVYGIWEKSFAGFCFSHIDIQDVGQILEGIERKSDGQCKLRIGKLQSCDHR